MLKLKQVPRDFLLLKHKALSPTDNYLLQNTNTDARAFHLLPNVQLHRLRGRSSAGDESHTSGCAEMCRVLLERR